VPQAQPVEQGQPALLAQQALVALLEQLAQRVQLVLLEQLARQFLYYRITVQPEIFYL
jgi:hypothetical protein